MGELDTLISKKLDEDTDFQAGLADLTDEEKTDKLIEKRAELLEDEFKSLKETANRTSKGEELAKNYKIRAEKAEQELKKLGVSQPPKKDDDGLSTNDFYALTNAKAHEDDVEWIAGQAKFAGKSIKNILKDEEIQAVLKLREEKRATAEAANTKPARSGSRKPDANQLQKDLSEGNVPEPGSEEAEELFWARRGGKPK